MKRWRGISVLLGAAVIPAALAGPLDPAVVDRNAGWMVHIDMEAALSSRVGGHMHAKVMKEDPQLFAVIEHDLGMNPTKAVKGVTMYGERMGADEGVVVLVTDEDADRWHRELPSRGLEGFARSGEGDSAANSWVVGGQTWFAAVRPGPTPERRRVVFTRSRASLDRALAVLSSRELALTTDAPAPMNARPAQGAVMFAVARNVSEQVGDKAQAQLARLVQTVVAEAGERDGKAFFGVSVQASDDQSAAEMLHFAQGGVAAMRLLARQEPQGKPLLDALSSIRFEQEGNRVRMSMERSADEVIAALDAMPEEPGPPGASPGGGVKSVETSGPAPAERKKPE